MSMMFSAKEAGFFAPSSSNLPKDAVEISNDEHAYLLNGLESGKRIEANSEGRPVLIDKEPMSLIDLATKKRREIERALADELAAGMPYTFPDGTEDVIQTRPQDEPNLLGLAIEARDLRDSDETEAVQELRAKSNDVYTITPEQMIEATDAAKAYKKSRLKKSWQLKAEIDAALEAKDRDALLEIDW